MLEGLTLPILGYAIAVICIGYLLLESRGLK